jgi:hypothetical protein
VLAALSITMQQLFETIITIVMEGVLTVEGRAKHLSNVLSPKLEPGTLS